MKIALTKKLLAGLVDSDPGPAPMPALVDVVEQARREWLSAQHYYNSVSDTDLVDHAVYLMQAAEKKYTYLLKQARREGVTHSLYQQ
jgi:hypothetical protein